MTQSIVTIESLTHLANYLQNKLDTVEAKNKALYTQIESQKRVISRLDKYLISLSKQRDELLAALIEARNLLEESVQCYENQMFRNAQIDAAIRKAKGE